MATYLFEIICFYLQALCVCQGSRLPSRVLFNFLRKARKIMKNLSTLRRKQSSLLSHAQNPLSGIFLCACQGSNLGPTEYQSIALPAELHAHIPLTGTRNTIPGILLNFNKRKLPDQESDYSGKLSSFSSLKLSITSSIFPSIIPGKLLQDSFIR